MKISTQKRIQKSLLTVMVGFISVFPLLVQALSVYQINAVMTYGGQLKTDTAFVILDNDASRFEEHGAGGYSLVLRIKENTAGRYTAATEIYADMGKGQILLGTPSVLLEKNTPAQVSFHSELVGEVILQLTLVKQAEVDEKELQECKYVECD